LLDSLPIFGGLSIVNGQHATMLRAVADPAKGDMVTIRWGNTDREVRPANGRLGGILEARDELVAGYLDSLNALAATLIEEFNAVHQGGYGLDDSHGLDFFVGTDASDIDLSKDIYDSLSKIAASSEAGTPGDGSNALRLASVYTEPVAALGGVTMRDFFT